eukprot:m.121403 g.121403  ORF g.121403 m.121403 type:complete len:98 (+) comp14393_c0_seq2:1096-1389(+)
MWCLDRVWLYQQDTQCKAFVFRQDNFPAQNSHYIHQQTTTVDQNFWGLRDETISLQQQNITNITKFKKKKNDQSNNIIDNFKKTKMDNQFQLCSTRA